MFIMMNHSHLSQYSY